MKKSNKQLAAIGLILLSSQSALAKDQQLCPDSLVSFWTNYSATHQNVNAIPEFLLKNHCFSKSTSNGYYSTAIKRLDNPEQIAYVEELYSQLAMSNTLAK